MKDEIVKVHLYKKGFKPNYWIWTDHGEQMPHVDETFNPNCMGGSSTGQQVTEEDQLMSMQEMMYNSVFLHETFEGSEEFNMEEPPNEAT